MKVTITITTGNSEMQDGDQVIEAIRRKMTNIANAVDAMKATGLPTCTGTVIDCNGNKVGSWKVTN